MSPAGFCFARCFLQNLSFCVCFFVSVAPFGCGCVESLVVDSVRTVQQVIHRTSNPAPPPPLPSRLAVQMMPSPSTGALSVYIGGGGVGSAQGSAEGAPAEKEELRRNLSLLKKKMHSQAGGRRSQVSAARHIVYTFLLLKCCSPRPYPVLPHSTLWRGRLPTFVTARTVRIARPPWFFITVYYHGGTL